jgi:site-specific recombinase XerD
MDEIIHRYKRDLALKGYSEKTCSAYLFYLKDFLKFTDQIGSSPEKEQIKDYLYYLIRERKLSDASIRQARASLKVLCTQTFGLQWSSMDLPARKTQKRLPSFYNFDEVILILKSSANLKHKALLTLIYSSGLRLSESVNLKMTDINRAKKKLLVRQGKGAKDRYTILSDLALLILEKYYKAYQPQTWLFPGPGRGDKPLSPRAVQHAFYVAKSKSGIIKEGGIHTLRHSFATHFLESGGGLFQLQKFLGHKQLKTTLLYAHVVEEKIHAISPLDYFYDNGQ